MTRRTVQEEQARLRKKRQKAQGFFSIYKKPMHESLTSVLPIMLIVLALGFTIAPVPNNAMMAFLLGGVLLIGGMGLFTLGSAMSMIPLGQAVGSEITRSKKVWVIVGISFLIGIIITVAEPDLQVLANQVPSIPNQTLIFSVAAGVGLFLVFAFLRMLIGIALPKLLVLFYGIIFVLAAFVPKEFLAVAFDSGGVASGPMTATFLLPLAQGACLAVGGNIVTDAFGVVAMVAMTPLITIQILGMTYQLKQRHASRTQQAYVDAFASLPEDAIIEL